MLSVGKGCVSLVIFLFFQIFLRVAAKNYNVCHAFYFNSLITSTYFLKVGRVNIFELHNNENDHYRFNEYTLY